MRFSRRMENPAARDCGHGLETLEARKRRAGRRRVVRRGMLAAVVAGLVACSGCFPGWQGFYGFRGQQGDGTVSCPNCGSHQLRRQLTGSWFGPFQPALKRGYRCPGCGMEFTEPGWIGGRR